MKDCFWDSRSIKVWKNKFSSWCCRTATSKWSKKITDYLKRIINVAVSFIVITCIITEVGQFFSPFSPRSFLNLLMSLMSCIWIPYKPLLMCSAKKSLLCQVNVSSCGKKNKLKKNLSLDQSFFYSRLPMESDHPSPIDSFLYSWSTDIVSFEESYLLYWWGRCVLWWGHSQTITTLQPAKKKAQTPQNPNQTTTPPPDNRSAGLLFVLIMESKLF